MFLKRGLGLDLETWSYGQSHQGSFLSFLNNDTLYGICTCCLNLEFSDNDFILLKNLWFKFPFALFQLIFEHFGN
jgi:hypothetical protein